MDEPGELDPTPTRTGPQPIPGDTWDAATGRHRSLPGKGPSRSARALIGTALTVVVAGVAVGLSLTGSDPVSVGSVAAGLPLPTASPTAAATVTTPPATSSAPPPTSTRPAPAFGPLVLEAEDVPRRSRRETQQVDLGPGREGIRFTDNRGELQFRSLAVPGSGTYRVTIVYAPHSDQRRTLVVDGSGPPVQVALERGTGCCRQVSVTVSLSARGTLTLRPTNWSGPRPAIDRVEITRA